MKVYKDDLVCSVRVTGGECLLNIEYEDKRIPLYDYEAEVLVRLLKAALDDRSMGKRSSDREVSDE